MIILLLIAGSICISGIFAVPVITLAQSDDPQPITFYEQADEAFENRQYDEAYRLLKETEKLLGAPNPMTLAMDVRIQYARKDHEGAQTSLSEFFRRSAHPELFTEMIDYAKKIDLARQEKILSTVRAKLREQEKQQQKYVTFIEEKLFIENLGADYAYSDGTRYYFFRPADRVYIRIDPAGIEGRQRYASSRRPADHDYGDTQSSVKHYLMAKLRKSNFFSPAYNDGFDRARVNRFYRPKPEIATAYAFETGSNVLFRRDLDRDDIESLVQQQFYEDLSDSPFDEYPAYRVETGTYHILAEAASIAALADDRSPVRESYYRLELHPSHRLDIMPMSTAELSYEGEVKAYVVSGYQDPGFRVSGHTSEGLAKSKTERVHRFSKSDIRTGWQLMVGEATGTPVTLSAATLVLDQSCWDIRSLIHSSPSKNEGCLPTNYAEFSDTPDVIGFFTDLAEYEKGKYHELFGDELTISLARF